MEKINQYIKQTFKRCKIDLKVVFKERSYMYSINVLFEGAIF